SEIQDARSAYIAWQLSQKYKSKQVSDFDAQKVEIMKEICRAKVEQHEDVKEALIESGTDVIIKNYPDEFWGIGMDGSGQNWMGKIWMQLREEIK
ncbi:MAG: NADAR family protein, partial [Patescibacteria group bacterium]|nr:NADAR family protein [Patescibacteria group bacterium]